MGAFNSKQKGYTQLVVNRLISEKI